MQVSALNLLIAAQQSRETPTKRTAIGDPAAVRETASFSPLAFDVAGAAKETGPMPSTARTADTIDPFAPPGTQVDIRV